MEALDSEGLEPIELEAKEGLALINGTQAMTAVLALAVLEAQKLVRIADLVGALSTDALRGADTAFDHRLHRTETAYPGQQGVRRESARSPGACCKRRKFASRTASSRRPGSGSLQRAVHASGSRHGAGSAWKMTAAKVEIELNAVTDNPLVFAGHLARSLSGGNFHGEPMALGADVPRPWRLAELGSPSPSGASTN